MTKVNVYSAKGTTQKKLNLPKNFEEKIDMALLAQAIYVYNARAHIGLAKVKTRSEVNRTTKKWYRQKGTGRARHGAKSAPIFVGGGVAHGPHGVKREVTLPKKMARKALNIALTLKAKDNEVFVVQGLNLLKKTKNAQDLIKRILKEKTKFSIILSDENLAQRRFFKNISGAKVESFKNLNAYKAFFGGVLVFDFEVFKPAKKKVVKGKDES